MFSFLDPFRDFSLTAILLKMLLTTLCGGLLGLEREKKRRPAGLRTHMLVCIGACSVMLTSQYILNVYPGGDPQRLGSQVISGIGFLGAGTIIVTGKNRVKGLTTAAGLWASACMGLTIGIGFYEGALISFLFLYLALTVFQKLDSYLYRHCPSAELYVELSDIKQIGAFLLFLHQQGLQVLELDPVKALLPQDGFVGMKITLEIPKALHRHEVLAYLYQWQGLRYAEEL